MDADPWILVDRKFRETDIDGAVQVLESLLAEEECERFKGLIGIQFSNPTSSVLSTINGFIAACERNFAVKAIYLEMNGFDINYDRWYVDFFGYSRYERNPDDLDWLCDWQSPNCPELELTGLEPIQQDFRWYHEERIWRDEVYKRPYEIATLLVVAKFVSLVQSALRSGQLAQPVPVLATAHDFDSIGRFEP